MTGRAIGVTSGRNGADEIPSLTVEALRSGGSPNMLLPDHFQEASAQPAPASVGSRRLRAYNSRMQDQDDSARDPLLLAVGDRIRNIREAKDIDPTGFATAAGFSLQYLWRLESGLQNLNLRSISRIALALDVPMSDLLAGIDPDPATIGPRPYRRKSAPRATTA